MAEPTHKFYTDDSGTKEYSPTGTYSTKGGVTPYFAFGGLLLTSGEAGAATKRLRAVKLAHFGTEQVEIKANWLRIAKEREKHYLNPFGLSDSQLNAFANEVYDLILAQDCLLIAAIVSKAEVIGRYGERAWYAPAIAYDCLAQRLQLEMSAREGGLVHVTIDDMDGATPKGKQYRDNLERHHKRLRTFGSALQRGMMMDRLAGLSFADSKFDERLQLADLVTYSVYRQFVDHGAAWDSPGAELPTYEYLARLAPKFRNHNGLISGYGIIKFPTVAHLRWGIKKIP